MFPAPRLWHILLNIGARSPFEKQGLFLEFVLTKRFLIVVVLVGLAAAGRPAALPAQRPSAPSARYQARAAHRGGPVPG